MKRTPSRRYAASSTRATKIPSPGPRQAFRPLDLVILALALALTAVSAVTAYGGGGAPRAVIQGAGKTWVFPLDAAETLRVNGPLGDTVVEIAGGTAAIISSPCQNQTCVAAGRLHGQGAWAACLPNQVMVYIEGDRGPVDGAVW